MCLRIPISLMITYSETTNVYEFLLVRLFLTKNLINTVSAIINCGLYIFYPIFHCGLYCIAVSVTDNLGCNQGNFSMFGSKIRGL